MSPAPGQVWRRVKCEPRTLHVLELVEHDRYGRRVHGVRCHVTETGRRVVMSVARMVREYRRVDAGGGFLSEDEVTQMRMK